MRHLAVAITAALMLLVSGFGKPVGADGGWGWIPANPPVTVPRLIAKGGRVVAVLGGRATKFLPYIKAEKDFTVGVFMVVYDHKLYRCITQDGQAKDDSRCFVAVNK